MHIYAPVPRASVSAHQKLAALAEPLVDHLVVPQTAHALKRLYPHQPFKEQKGGA